MKPSRTQLLLLIVALFVIAAPVLAQTSASPAMAGAGDASMALPDAPTPQPNRAPSVAAVGRPTFGGEQVVDREFVVVNGLMFGSTFANVELTSRCIWSGACSLVPDGLRRRRYLYAVGLPADVGIGVLGYYLKRGGHRWWFVPAAILTAGNAVYGIHAAQHIR